ANVEISINNEPKKAKALVLFLSPNSSEEEKLEKFKSLEGFKSNNYFMPLTAIDYHKNRLTKLVIACSDQSFNDKDKFSKCVQNIFGSNIAKIIEIKSAGDFEKAKNVYDFLENTYEELKKEGFKEDDIVFDVTGGQKVIAIAGAMFAIPNDRHLQYVSTNDYSVKHYDLTYIKNEE
ncbi:MAG: TM1812 family CRISPR-associated protein, partial [Campylobacter concisus]|nr:TM1812 family CRISPR-associated protein [Campylobacter concisus]